MKKVIYLSIMLAILALLAPGICGFYFRQQYLSAIAGINADKHIIISVSHYQLGWFSSTAVIDVYPSNIMSDHTKITLKQTIKHGPVFLTSLNKNIKINFVGIRTDVYLPMAIQHLFYPQAQKPLVVARLYSLINFLGNYTSKMIVESLANDNMSWEGLSSKASFKIDDSEISNVKYNLAFSDLSAATDSAAIIPNTKLSIHPFYISLTGDKVATDDWNMGLYFQMPMIMIDAPNAWKFHLDNANLNQEFESHANFYHSKTLFSFSRFTMPGFLLDDAGPLTLNIMINNLDAKQLTEFSALIPVAEDESFPLFWNQLDNWIAKAITQKTTANINGSLNTSFGDININAAISLPADQLLPITLMQVVNNANVKMDIAISSTFLKLLSDQFSDVLFSYIDHTFQTYPYQTTVIEKHPINLVAQWEEKGLLIPDNEHYTFVITRENGTILINGKPLSALQPMPKAISDPYKKIPIDPN